MTSTISNLSDPCSFVRASTYRISIYGSVTRDMRTRKTCTIGIFLYEKSVPDEMIYSFANVMPIHLFLHSALAVLRNSPLRIFPEGVRSIFSNDRYEASRDRHIHSPNGVFWIIIITGTANRGSLQNL